MARRLSPAELELAAVGEALVGLVRLGGVDRPRGPWMARPMSADELRRLRPAVRRDDRFCGPVSAQVALDRSAWAASHPMAIADCRREPVR
jgi:hypothetical protein